MTKPNLKGFICYTGRSTGKYVKSGIKTALKCSRKVAKLATIAGAFPFARPTLAHLAEDRFNEYTALERKAILDDGLIGGLSLDLSVLVPTSLVISAAKLNPIYNVIPIVTTLLDYAVERAWQSYKDSLK